MLNILHKYDWLEVKFTTDLNQPVFTIGSKLVDAMIPVGGGGHGSLFPGITQGSFIFL